VAYFLKNS